ncbi:restriction endonuclease subunit S [Staphylococcus aureus]|uniref:restriction endonuclease subunit S n=3 Tax=Bacteria TaxID=2 RepID=UPI000DFA782C|nr:restriction endonuclease subunit S [Staphylococcus aureus]SUK08041.1 type I restriction-modification system, S subunit [Staphylococcus aureus]SUK12666.1 type I restriction-modification system, S subunit [Staphylococcus aureus]
MSNTQKKNVPELRFPGFEDEWEEKKLGELCEFNNGINAKKEQYGMGRKFINVLDILNNNFITYESIIGKVSVPENVEKNNKVEFGDLVFLRSSETREDVGLCNVYLDKNYALYGGFIIRGKKVSDYNPIFLKEALNIPKKRYEIGSAAGGSTRFNVSQDILRKINVKFPPIKEQQKIGDLFSKLDRQIELEEQKLELLKQQKKGYMQKIFSQELRFKDENGNDYPDWTNERLGEVTTVTMGQSPKSVNYTDNSNDTVLIQGNADIENGLINPRIYTREVTKLIQKDEIILTVRAPVGKLAMAQINACIGRGVCSIKGDKFLYYFLEWFATQNKWIRFSQGSTFESISGNDIRNIHIKIPVEDERTKIIKLLNSLDVLNSKTDLKIQNLKQRKQSLLQKIFV